jgi:hypothetical protein
MPSQHYLDNCLAQLRKLKELADKAIIQVTDDALYHEPDPQSNSIAVIMIHIAGNLRSRWTDFLTTDGEKPDRHRDREFVVGDYNTRERLLLRWETGWHCAFSAIERLTPPDLERTVTIRSEPHTVIEAINRQLAHNAYHVGQIVYCARFLAGKDWKTLSVPRGESEAFNAAMRSKFGSDEA